MGSGEKFPSLGQPELAYHGLNFSETFGDLAFTMFSHAVTLRDLGSTMAPMHAWLTLNGCETLSVRMEPVSECFDHCSPLGGTPEGKLGVIRRARIFEVQVSLVEVHARIWRSRFHIRRGWFRGWSSRCGGGGALQSSGKRR